MEAKQVSSYILIEIWFGFIGFFKFQFCVDQFELLYTDSLEYGF